MKVKVGQLVTRIAGMAVVFGLVLFLPAGTIDWWAGWAFLILFLGFVIVLSAWLLRYNPDLLAERMSGIGHPDQKTWDKVYLVWTGFAFFAWLALMSLDAVRFRWSHVPRWFQGAGALILLGSFYLFFLTFRENTYLSPVVRIQKERGQTVVSTGPYRYVRHPMYAAFALMTVGTALLLGSWYGLSGVPILIGMVARRAVLEEQVLRQELAGYCAYEARVRFRLVPYIW
jgi:protein-S-isoprenylcysteine O-methyltransferase Ste14